MQAYVFFCIFDLVYKFDHFAQLNQIILFMINQKAPTKRGRPKRKNSESDGSIDQFTKRKTSKKTQKTAIASKKNIESDKGKKKKITQKSKIQFSESSDSEPQESIEIKEQNAIKTVTIPLEMFKPDKLFADILNRANKEPQFLIMLRNLLSGCSRVLRDKKMYLKRRWEQLRNSNCTQDEYLSRQGQLKRMENEQIDQIQKDIMTKLSYANIKGFELRDAIIEDHKQILMNEGKFQTQTQYYIEEQIWGKYNELQKKLLSLLMNQKDLVFSNTSDSFRGTAPVVREKPNIEENQIDIKFSNIQTQENPQSTQFLFCKHFSEINYDKIFQSSSNPFKLHQNQIYFMDTKALSWILQSKSDQIYTNQKYQKETYKRYTQMLQNIYSSSVSLSDQQLIEQLLQITAYVLNSVHYYQKFKLKCDLLHPLDLLLVIEKIKKERRKQKLQFMVEQNFEKELEILSGPVHQANEQLLSKI